MTRLLSPHQWRTIDASSLAAHRHLFLCTDQRDPEANARILYGPRYEPDTFTVVDRASSPGFLDPAERDLDAWLTALIERRTAAVVQPRGVSYQHQAVHHVRGEVSRVLEARDGGATVADTLFNQEVPYVLDRVAAWCLLADPLAEFDHYAEASHRAHTFIATLFAHHADEFRRMTPLDLLTLALSAGLVGLDLKGGHTRAHVIPLGGTAKPTDPAAVWRSLAARAASPLAVDHSADLLNAVARGSCGLVWFLDDLIETAFDLLVIQRLAAINPRLRVYVVPKNGRHDNDASTPDVVRFLRLPALSELAAAIETGQVELSSRGPRMGTAHPLKLATTVADAIDRADLLFIKGGRAHEMFMGNLNKTIFTGYVVVREFTESQAGLDAATTPLLLFAAQPGAFPWWGFTARAHRTLTLPSGRTVRACQSTVIEHERRAQSADTSFLTAQLNWLDSQRPERPPHPRATQQERRFVADRLRTLHYRWSQPTSGYPSPHTTSTTTPPGATT